MNPRRITDATMRIRDYLYESLLLRKIPEDIARERANNMATGVLEVIRQLAAEEKATDAPPPVRGNDNAEETAPEWETAPEVRKIRTT